MTPSDDLFRLVKSLTRSEKGYFRKYSSRHAADGQNTYSILFDAIDRQDEYNEARIREAFRDRAFIRRLPALKNYLYNLILRSLRAYNAEASHSRRLRGLLDDHATLLNKNLYDQAEKAIERARALADRHHLNYYKPVIEVYRRKLQSAQFMSGTTTERMEESLAYERQTIEELLRFNGLETINKRLFKHISEQGQRSADAPELRAILTHPLMSGLDDLQWTGSRFLFYQIQSTYAYYIREYRQSKAHILEALGLIASNPQYAATYPFVESSLLNNLASLCILLYEPEEAEMYIERLRTLPATAFVNETERFTSVRVTELDLYLKLGDITSLRRLLPVLLDELHTFRHTLGSYYRRYFAYHLGWVYIALGEPGRALEHLNIVLNDRSADVREDLYCFARILNLLVHYELGNTELLRSEVRSTWRYLAQKQHTYRFETLLVQFIKKAISASSARAVQREFATLRQELIALQHDPAESRAFTYFHFIPWLDSQIQGVSFAEAVEDYTRKEKEKRKPANA